MDKQEKSFCIFTFFIIAVLLTLKLTFLIIYSQNFTYLTLDEVGRRGIILGLKNVHFSPLYFLKYSAGIWLPVYFYFYGLFLLLYNNIWFTIQIVSAIVSLLVLLFAFLIGRHLYSNTSGLIACFILILSTDVNLLSVSAYSMMLSSFGLIAFVYFLSIWLYNEKSINLLYSSLSLLFYVGTRYESWPLIVFLWGVWILNSIKNKKIKIIEAAYLFIPPIFCIIWMVRCKIMLNDYFIFTKNQNYDQLARKEIYFPSYYFSMMEYYFSGFWIFLGVFITSYPYILSKIKNKKSFVYSTLLFIFLGALIIQVRGQIWNWYPQGAYIPLLVLLSVLVAVSFSVFFNEAKLLYKIFGIILLFVVGIINFHNVYEMRFGLPAEAGVAEGNSLFLKFIDEKEKELKKINVFIFNRNTTMKELIEMRFNYSPSVNILPFNNSNGFDYLLASEEGSGINLPQNNIIKYYEIKTYHGYKSFSRFKIFAPIKQDDTISMPLNSFNYHIEKKNNYYELFCVFPYYDEIPQKIYLNFLQNNKIIYFDLTNNIEKITKIKNTHLSYIFTLPKNIPNGDYNFIVMDKRNCKYPIKITIPEQFNNTIAANDIFGEYDTIYKIIEIPLNKSAFIGYQPKKKCDNLLIETFGEPISNKQWSKVDIYINSTFVKTIHLNYYNFAQKKIIYTFNPNEYYVIELRGNNENGGAKVYLRSIKFSATFI